MVVQTVEAPQVAFHPVEAAAVGFRRVAAGSSGHSWKLSYVLEVVVAGGCLDGGGSGEGLLA